VLFFLIQTTQFAISSKKCARLYETSSNDDDDDDDEKKIILFRQHGGTIDDEDDFQWFQNENKKKAHKNWNFLRLKKIKKW
jgi:hypothetical protein